MRTPSPDRVRHRDGRGVPPAPGGRRPSRSFDVVSCTSRPRDCLETRLFPDLEYTYAALTHEVAYQGLLHNRPAPCTPASPRPSSGSRRARRRAGRAAGPPCPAWGAVGAGGRLSPPGRAPGHGAGHHPRGHRPPGTGARGRRPSPRDPGDDRADRPPHRPPERTSPARRVGAHGGAPPTRRRGTPGRSATRTGSRGLPPSW